MKIPAGSDARLAAALAELDVPLGSVRTKALKALGALGPLAAPAVPRIEELRHTSSAKSCVVGLKPQDVDYLDALSKIGK